VNLHTVEAGRHGHCVSPRRSHRRCGGFPRFEGARRNKGNILEPEGLAVGAIGDGGPVARPAVMSGARHGQRAKLKIDVSAALMNTGQSPPQAATCAASCIPASQDNHGLGETGLARYDQAGAGPLLIILCDQRRGSSVGGARFRVIGAMTMRWPRRFGPRSNGRNKCTADPRLQGGFSFSRRFRPRRARFFAPEASNPRFTRLS